MKNYLLPVLVFFLVGCPKKPTCERTDKYAETVGKGIAVLLECQNPAQIAADLRDQVDTLNLCTDVTISGPIASVVCRPVTKYATTLIVKNIIPKKWECRGGLPATALDAFLYNGCLSFPF